MYEFLVLGIIPGTEVRISFDAWILISAAVMLYLNRKNFRRIIYIAQRVWALRYHVAAVISLITLSLKRKIQD